MVAGPLPKVLVLVLEIAVAVLVSKVWRQVRLSVSQPAYGQRVWKKFKNSPTNKALRRRSFRIIALRSCLSKFLCYRRRTQYSK